MTCVVTNPQHQQHVETAIQRVAANIRLELNLNKPEYTAIMETNEAFSRIRQLLMAVCELYELKEQLWAEVSDLDDVITTEASTLLDNRHAPINETIYQRILEINYLSQFLNPQQQTCVDGYIDQIRPDLEKCVPRTIVTKHLMGVPHEDPQQWYAPKRPALSEPAPAAVAERRVITATALDIGEHKERRTRSPKFA